MTRTEIAKRALTTAIHEDAIDAQLRPCKLCGAKAERYVVPADVSMHSGWAIVQCPAGHLKIKVLPETMFISVQSGETTLDAMGRALITAEAEALRRWQLFNG